MTPIWDVWTPKEEDAHGWLQGTGPDTAQAVSIGEDVVLAALLPRAKGVKLERRGPDGALRWSRDYEMEGRDRRGVYDPTLAGRVTDRARAFRLSARGDDLAMFAATEEGLVAWRIDGASGTTAEPLQLGCTTKVSRRWALPCATFSAGGAWVAVPEQDAAGRVTSVRVYGDDLTAPSSLVLSDGAAAPLALAVGGDGSVTVVSQLKGALRVELVTSAKSVVIEVPMERGIEDDAAPQVAVLQGGRVAVGFVENRTDGQAVVHLVDPTGAEPLRVELPSFTGHPRVNGGLRLLVPTPDGGVLAGVQAIGEDEVTWYSSGRPQTQSLQVAGPLGLAALDRDLRVVWTDEVPAEQAAANPCDLGVAWRIVDDGVLLAYRGGGDVDGIRADKMMAAFAADDAWRQARPVLAHVSWGGVYTTGRLDQAALGWSDRCLALDAIAPYGDRWLVAGWVPFGRSLLPGSGSIGRASEPPIGTSPTEGIPDPSVFDDP